MGFKRARDAIRRQVLPLLGSVLIIAKRSCRFDGLRALPVDSWLCGNICQFDNNGKADRRFNRQRFVWVEHTSGGQLDISAGKRQFPELAVEKILVWYAGYQLHSGWRVSRVWD